MSDTPDIELKMTLDAKALNTGLDSATAKVTQSADKMAASLGKVDKAAQNTQSSMGKINMKGVVSLVGMAAFAVGRKMEQSENENTRVAGGVIQGAGAGATIGSQIAGPWGAAMGALAGAAYGLTNAGDKLVKESEARLKVFEQNKENNTAKIKEFRRNEARTDESENFADKMGDSSISYAQKMAMLEAREKTMQDTKDRADKVLNKPNAMEHNELTATALSMYSNSKAELKKMADMRKNLGKDTSEGDGISHGNYASNALTKMGGGINGLTGFDSAQKETNTLLKKSITVLEKISSKTGSTTATWGK